MKVQVNFKEVTYGWWEVEVPDNATDEEIYDIAWDEDEETYKDINGVELAVSDEVQWLDEAGYDENGDPITFTIVEERGDGYFNLSYGDEDENPERWAYYTELEIV